MNHISALQGLLPDFDGFFDYRNRKARVEAELHYRQSSLPRFTKMSKRELAVKVFQQRQVKEFADAVLSHNADIFDTKRFTLFECCNIDTPSCALVEYL